MAFAYSEKVRLSRATILIAALALGTAGSWLVDCAQAQPPQQKAAPKDQMFSGVVTGMGENSLTAVRAGSKESKTFAITAETKIDGPKPRVGLSVTIRYVVTDQGDRALRVIVREAPKK